VKYAGVRLVATAPVRNSVAGVQVIEHIYCAMAVLTKCVFSTSPAFALAGLTLLAADGLLITTVSVYQPLPDSAVIGSRRLTDSELHLCAGYISAGQR